MDTFDSPIVIAALGGAFGGIVLGIIRETSYKIRLLGGRVYEIGFFGDALIGMAAALSVFSVISGILNIQLSETLGSEELMKLLAISVIAGFAGISLLQKLSDNLVAKVDALDQDVKKLKALEESHRLYKRGEYHTHNAEHDLALDYYNNALEINPEDRDALVRKAMTLKSLGRINDAFDLLGTHIKKTPNDDVALYNRACYRALLDHDLDTVISDLSSSMSISHWSYNQALTDTDLDSLRESPEFKELMDKHAPKHDESS